MMNEKLLNLMEMHEDMLVVHSHLVLEGNLEEASFVQEKLDVLWEDIKNLLPNL